MWTFSSCVVCLTLSYATIASSVNSVGLFRFGFTAGDTLQASCDNCASTVDLSNQPITFFGRSFSKIKVSSNGWLAFSGDADTTCGPNYRPEAANFEFLSAFWDDTDTRAHGHVFFRFSATSTDLKKAASIIQLTGDSIVPLVILVATWNGTIAKSNQEDQHLGENTFQAIIASDGGKTYGIVLISNIEWTICPGLTGFHAVESGTSKSVLMTYGSQYSGYSSDLSLFSNYPVGLPPGVFVFKLFSNVQNSSDSKQPVTDVPEDSYEVYEQPTINKLPHPIPNAASKDQLQDGKLHMKSSEAPLFPQFTVYTSTASTCVALAYAVGLLIVLTINF